MEAEQLSSLTLLHLSRLKLTGGAAAERQADVLAQDLAQQVTARCGAKRPDALIVSGDLSAAGKPSEFVVAQRFLAGLASLLSIARDAIVVVPGNHDINRKSCEAYFNQCEAEERAPEPPYFPKLVHFAAFFARLHEAATGPQFLQEAPYSFFELAEQRCVIAALNSTMADTHRPEDHGGFVGEAQLRFFAEKLRPYQERGFLRLAVVHHDSTDVSPRSLRDVERLRRLLGASIHALLIGQPGANAVDWLSPGVPAFRAVGSELHFQLLRLTAAAVQQQSWHRVEDGWRRIEDSPAAGVAVVREWAEVPWQPIAASLAFSPCSAIEGTNEATLARTVSAYRRRMVEQWQRQTFEELATRGDDREIPQGLSLLDIYVPQFIASRLPLCDLPSSALSDTTPLAAILSNDETSVGFSPAPTVTDLLAQSDWAVLLGSPGAGKSTLIRWLCLKLCQPGEALPGVPMDVVPVRIEARDFAAYLSQRAGALAQTEPPNASVAVTSSAASASAAAEPGQPPGVALLFSYIDQAHLRRLLPLHGAPLRELYQRGRLLFLFDGLDEISDPQVRLRCVEHLCELHAQGETTPRVRVLLTSRIVGVDHVMPRLQASGIAAFTLQDFSQAQIAQFVSTWYARTCTLLGRPQDADTYAQRLLRAVEQNKALAELCGRPLLLTLLVLLGRSGELPRSRHLLYQRAVELLAEEWHPSPHGDWGLDRLGKLAFLRALAAEMLTNPGPQENAIEESALRKFAASFLRLRDPELGEQIESRVDGLIQQLREKNQILADVGGHHYGFVHRAFLEYLAADSLRTAFAAHYLTVEQLQDIFAHSWTLESWQEPLILLSGMLGEDRPELVARALQSIATQEGIIDSEDLNFLLFALSCFGSIPQRNDAMAISVATQILSLLMGELNCKDDDFWQSADNLSISFSQFGQRWMTESEWSRWINFVQEHIRSEYTNLKDGELSFFALSSIENPYLTEDHIVEVGCFFLAHASMYEDMMSIIHSMFLHGVHRNRLFGERSPLPPIAEAVFLACMGQDTLSTTDRLRQLAAQSPMDDRISALVELAEIINRSDMAEYEGNLLRYYRLKKNTNLLRLIVGRLKTKKAKRELFMMHIAIFSSLPTSEIEARFRDDSVGPRLIDFLNTFSRKPLFRYKVLRHIQAQSANNQLPPEDWAARSESAHEETRLLAWESVANAYGSSRRAYAELRRLAETAQDEAVRRRAGAALASLQQLYRFSRVAKPARRRAEVRLDGEPVGLLEETETGTQFLYDPAYLRKSDAVPLSPTLPVQGGQFASLGLLPFFDNLLPEGWLLDLASQQHHIDRSDGMGLLLHTGIDCIGAVEIIALGEDEP